MPDPNQLSTTLDKALYLAVATLAFHGRDRGSDRQDGMLDDLEALAREVDPLIREAISKDSEVSKPPVEVWAVAVQISKVGVGLTTNSMTLSWREGTEAEALKHALEFVTTEKPGFSIVQYLTQRISLAPREIAA